MFAWNCKQIIGVISRVVIVAKSVSEFSWQAIELKLHLKLWATPRFINFIYNNSQIGTFWD